jgi:hypothetical protein
MQSIMTCDLLGIVSRMQPSLSADSKLASIELVE